MKTYLLSAVLETLWAIRPEKLAAIVGVVMRHARGETLSAEDIAAVAAARPAQRQAGEIAVLPLFGTLAPRANLMTESSGGTSLEMFGAAFRRAMTDPGVSAVVLDVNSPGGAVYGVDELSAEIYRTRGTKPVVAVADHLAASAAYWIATAADELVVSPSGEVGSIGVFAAHEDMSRAMDAEGVTTTLVSAGKYKTEGNPFQPLTDEARAAIQSRVDEYYAMFVKAVARQRGASAEAVRNGFGEGRVVGAKDAVALGMADRIATLDEVIAGLQRPPRQARGASADTRQRRLRLAQHL